MAYSFAPENIEYIPGIRFAIQRNDIKMYMNFFEGQAIKLITGRIKKLMGKLLGGG